MLDFAPATNLIGRTRRVCLPLFALHYTYDFCSSLDNTGRQRQTPLYFDNTRILMPIPLII